MVGGDGRRFRSVRGACIWVGVKAGKVCGSDLYANLVALQKSCGGSPEVDFKAGGGVRREKLLVVVAISVASADDTVGDIKRRAIGEDVAKFDGEVGIEGGRSGEESGGNVADDVEVLLEGGRCKEKEVGARFNGSLISLTGADGTQVISSAGWGWVCWVVRIGGGRSG